MPQGVLPPAQLPKVPSTRVPAGSAEVLSRSFPAAGPEISIGVVAVRRRANLLSGTTFQPAPSRAISMTAPPTEAISTATWSFVAFSAALRPLPRPANIRLGLVYSWFATIRKRSPLRLPAGSG